MFLRLINKMKINYSIILQCNCTNFLLLQVYFIDFVIFYFVILRSSNDDRYKWCVLQTRK